ncbi:DUF362 domain-containing protein [Candidatus Bathyarchaeota archaeon]|nr:DUF362 domain-containing protein [Candidatus Bathyarchaeota archaeon]
MTIYVTMVAIVKGTKPVDVTVKALRMIDVDEVLSEEKPILVKPNYIDASHPSTGITTDSRVIEGVVKFLKNRGVKNIVIGEGSGYADTFKAFEVAGVDEVAKRWNVGLVDLNEDEFVKVDSLRSLVFKRMKIAKTALESTIISVPKLKLHRMTDVTLSIKNMMGVINPKGSMHTRLNKNIVDLASVVKPSIAVVDGIVAGEGHETSGNPVEMNLVIAGTDPIAVDAVGAAVMSITPKNVKHLRLAEKKGLGTCDLEQIEIIGESIESVKKKFRRSLSSKLLRHLA